MQTRTACNFARPAETRVQEGCAQRPGHPLAPQLRSPRGAEHSAPPVPGWLRAVPRPARTAPRTAPALRHARLSAHEPRAALPTCDGLYRQRRPPRSLLPPALPARSGASTPARRGGTAGTGTPRILPSPTQPKPQPRPQPVPSPAGPLPGRSPSCAARPGPAAPPPPAPGRRPTGRPAAPL